MALFKPSPGSEAEALNKNMNWLDWCSDSCEIKEKKKSVRASERDDKSGSSQRIEAAHTNRRELSQEPLAHTAGTQAGQQAVPGTRQKGQAVRENSQRERADSLPQAVTCQSAETGSQKTDNGRESRQRQDCQTAGCQAGDRQRTGS